MFCTSLLVVVLLFFRVDTNTVEAFSIVELPTASTSISLQQQRQRRQQQQNHVVLFSLSSSSPLEDNVENVDIVICGGGPTGLLSAIMLSQKFPNVSM
jgi:peptidase E